MNRQVSVHLKLKLFDFMISLIALFAISFFYISDKFRNVRAQMKMLRSIVRWVRISDEPWSDTMNRMNQRMDRAAAMHFVKS